MLGFLRRYQPSNPILAVLFWLLAVAIAVAVLFVAFYYLDNLLPAQF